MFTHPCGSKEQGLIIKIMTEETKIKTNGKREFGRSIKLVEHWVRKIKRCTSKSINKSTKPLRNIS